MIVHVWLCRYVFCCLIVGVKMVDVLSVPIEYHYVSDILCRCISSAQGNILASCRGVDDESFRPATPVDEYAVEVIHCATRALSCFYLSCKINVCHACLCDLFSRTCVCEFLCLWLVVWLLNAIFYILFSCLVT